MQSEEAEELILFRNGGDENHRENCKNSSASRDWNPDAWAILQRIWIPAFLKNRLAMKMHAL